MKKLLTIMVLLTVLFSSCEKEKLMTASEIPGEIRKYISSNFPNDSIIQSLEETDVFTKTYEIILAGNIHLEFNRKKEITGIEGNTKLPDSVIPEKISRYVTANYATNVITSWDLEDKNQQVDLDNGLELVFDKSGTFLRIDN